MRKKKKGYFLIELLIYTSIAMVIIILCFNVLLLLTKEFVAGIKESNYEKAITATDITLKSRIQGPFIESVTVEDNKLKIKHTYADKTTDTDEIFLNKSNEKLQIKYFVAGAGTTTNTILSGVTSFSSSSINNSGIKDNATTTAIDKGRLIYLKVKIKDYGEKIFVYEKM